MEQIITHPQRIRQVVSDLIEHYEDRQHLVAGKAMIVAYSRKAAWAMYQEMMAQRPEWKNKVRMVMTSNNQDEEDMAKLIGNKKTQKTIRS